MKLKIMEPYQRVSRDLYEELEVLSYGRQRCDITYEADNGAVGRLSAMIDQLYTNDEEEYLIVAGGLKIRLDKILTLNGHPPQYYC